MTIYWDVIRKLQPEDVPKNAIPVAVWPEDPPEKVQYLLIGEAPGREEVNEGKPFVGRSGKLLRELVRDVLGPASKAVHYTNASLYRPNPRGGDDQRPLVGQVLKERDRLYAEIGILKPEVVVALGSTAAYAMLGNAPRHRGLAKGMCLFGHTFLLYVTHHPSRVLRDPDWYKDLVEDFERAKRREVPEPCYIPPFYVNPEEVDFNNEEVIFVDVETDSTNWSTAQLRCVAVVTGRGRTYLWTPDSLSSLVSGLASYRGEVVGHNACGDEIVLRRYNVPIRFKGDTILHHYATDERRATHGLKVLAPTIGGCETAIHLIWKYLHGAEGSDVGDSHHANWAAIPESDLYPYCVRDVYCTRRVSEGLSRRHDGRVERLYAFLKRAYRAFTEGMVQGIRVDTEALESTLSEWEQRVVHLRSGFDFNPDAPKEVLARLRKEGYNISDTRKETLGRLKGPLPESLLRYKKEAKILKGFLRPLGGLLDGDGCVHPSYKLYGTESGRTSATGPNIQQVPGLLKSLFVSRNGYTFVGWDFVTHEVRGICYFAQDKQLSSILRDVHNDVHGIIAEKVGITRYQAKRSLFGTAYGVSERGLAEKVGLSQAQAKEVMEAVGRLFPALPAWAAEVKRKAWEDGYVETPYGYRRVFWYADERTRSRMERIAVNFLPQSLCNSVCMDGAIQVFEKLGYPPLLYVHDFVAVEVPEGKAEEIARQCKDIVSNVFPNDIVEWVPDIHIGKTWADLGKKADDTEEDESDESEDAGEDYP